MVLWRLRWWAGICVAVLAVGCRGGEAPSTGESAPATENPATSATNAVSTNAPAETPAAKPPAGGKSTTKKRKGNTKPEEKLPDSDAPDYATPQEKLDKGILERPDAARMVVSLVKESAGYGPTLVVWVVDRSTSCREMVMHLGRLLETMSADLAEFKGEGKSIDEARLLTAVCSFGADVKIEVDPPSPDPQAISQAITKMIPDNSGKEVTFAAIKAAMDKYLDYRTKKQREVVFVILSDEAGDDAEMLDQIIDAPRKAGVPFYVIGVPAPFGRDAALSPGTEVGLDYKPTGKWLAIRQGPESRAAERIRLGFWGGSNAGVEFMDSGFGPFPLERLCRATGGRYLALRPAPREFMLTSAVGMEWPSPAVTVYDPAVMRKYVPDYVSDQEYQALLSNKARRAVCDAAQLGDMELLEFPNTSFVKGDEAAMANMLSKAQQIAAKLSPTVDRLYEILEKGEADRAKLTEPRWQANFDLAMGRAAAAKAKVDGYNHMLAALKRGKTFQNAGSTTWVLEPADTIEGASALQKLIDKAKSSLQRVVEQHAGTPWAKIAERDLQTPSGWKWIER